MTRTVTLRPRTGNLFDHPLAVPDWELAEASPVRVTGRSDVGGPTR